MQRIYLDGLKPMAPPPRGTNGWIVRSRRTVLYATQDGFFQEDAEGLHRANLADTPAEQTAVVVGAGGMHGVSDKSTWDKGEQVWRLPAQHTQLVLDVHVFAPRAMGPVRLAFSLCNGKTHDTYIEVDEGVSQGTVDNDVDTLLSGLKSCDGYIACSQPH